MGSGSAGRKGSTNACTAKKGLGCIVAFIMCGIPLLVAGITLTILYYDGSYALGVGGVAMTVVAGIALIATLIIAMMSLRRTHEHLRRVLKAKKKPLEEEMTPMKGVNGAAHCNGSATADTRIALPADGVNEAYHKEESSRRGSDESPSITVDVEHVPPHKDGPL